MSEDNNIVVNNAELSAENTSETYSRIRNSVITAQSRIYNAVNTAMVQAYWEIGEQIYIACGENERAEYGKGLLKYLSEKLTAEFGTGFTERNLRNMRQFYQAYPIRHTVCTELSWSHYRILMRISDDKRREWYTEECAKSGWSVRQLERQINTMFYERLLSSKEKDAVAAEIQTTEPKPEYEKIIRDPYVLEFLQQTLVFPQGYHWAPVWKPVLAVMPEDFSFKFKFFQLPYSQGGGFKLSELSLIIIPFTCSPSYLLLKFGKFALQ